MSLVRFLVNRTLLVKFFRGGQKLNTIFKYLGDGTPNPHVVQRATVVPFLLILSFIEREEKETIRESKYIRTLGKKERLL